MMKAVFRVLCLLSLGLLIVPAGFAGGEETPKKDDSKKSSKAASVKSDSPADVGNAAPAHRASKAKPKDKRSDPKEQPSREWKPMPATTGTLGIFTVETGDTLPKSGVSFSAYVNKFSRAPGSNTVLNLGFNAAYGVTDRLTIYGGMEPYRHVHVGQPEVLSLNSPLSNPQFDNTIYRVPFPAFSDRPTYVEDFPFAFNNNGGIGDVTFGAKFSLWSELRGDPISLSIRNDAIIPTHRDLSDLLQVEGQTGGFADQISVAGSKTFGNFVTGALNFGYRFTRDPRTTVPGVGEIHDMTLADQVRLGGGFIILPNHRFQLLMEYTGIVFVGDHTPNMTFGPRDPVDGVWGGRLYLTKNIALDAGYRYMLNQPTTEDRNGFIIKLGTVYWPEKPKPPDVVTASCSADKTSVMEGSNETVNISVQANDSLGHTLTYTWTATGGSIQGSGAAAVWRSQGVKPGTYTVTVRADDGNGNVASCSEDIRVEAKPAPPPPTMSCSAERTTAMPGERVGITATVNDQTGTQLNYTWRSNGGEIVGSGASVQLDTSNLAPGNYTVTGRVENGVGGAADCSVGVAVQAPPPKPQASKINQCYFKRANISRVDNVCKRVLDDLALRLQNEPKAKVVIIGYADPKERKAERLANVRAQNAKKYLTGKGIADDRIETRTGAGQAGAGNENRRVDYIFVPEGASY